MRRIADGKRKILLQQHFWHEEHSHFTAVRQVRAGSVLHYMAKERLFGFCKRNRYAKVGVELYRVWE